MLGQRPAGSRDFGCGFVGLCGADALGYGALAVRVGYLVHTWLRCGREAPEGAAPLSWRGTVPVAPITRCAPPLLPPLHAELRHQRCHLPLVGAMGLKTARHGLQGVQKVVRSAHMAGALQHLASAKPVSTRTLAPVCMQQRCCLHSTAMNDFHPATVRLLSSGGPICTMATTTNMSSLPWTLPPQAAGRAAHGPVRPHRAHVLLPLNQRHVACAVRGVIQSGRTNSSAVGSSA